MIIQNGLQYIIDLDQNKEFSIKPTEDIYSELTLFQKKEKLFFNYGKNRITINSFKNIHTTTCPTEALSTIGVSYSIVVNNQKQHYAEIGISNWCSIHKRLEISTNKNVQLNQLRITNGPKFTERELKKDLEERLIGYNPRKKWF